MMKWSNQEKKRLTSHFVYSNLTWKAACVKSCHKKILKLNFKLNSKVVRKKPEIMFMTFLLFETSEMLNGFHFDGSKTPFSGGFGDLKIISSNFTSTWNTLYKPLHELIRKLDT